MENALSISNVTKAFGGVKVVKNISFDVKKGDIMGTLGPNGAGKTTLIRNIMGMIYPDQGEVSFFLGGKKERLPLGKIGYLPEERGLYKDVSIQDIIFYLAGLKGYPKGKAKVRLSKYLEKFDLGGMEKRKIEELSKGMAQKVQFIGAVIHEPEFLILDEPFSGLDPVSQDLFREEIRSLSDAGVSILLSSHQMNLVEALCNRIFLINQGEKVIYGTLDEVKKQFADFKCTIYGKNSKESFEKLSGVERVEAEEGKAVIYLSKDTTPQGFFRQLSKEININELHMDRISLHDIFVNIAKGGKIHGTNF